MEEDGFACARRYRKLRMASRSTRRPITPLAPSIWSIASAGTSRRRRERKPARTESASGTSGAVPYIGHSTFPTSRPRLSATMYPAVRRRSRASALLTLPTVFHVSKENPFSRVSIVLIPLSGAPGLNSRIPRTAEDPKPATDERGSEHSRNRETPRQEQDGGDERSGPEQESGDDVERDGRAARHRGWSASLQSGRGCLCAAPPPPDGDDRRGELVARPRGGARARREQGRGRARRRRLLRLPVRRARRRAGPTCDVRHAGRRDDAPAADAARRGDHRRSGGRAGAGHAPREGAPRPALQVVPEPAGGRVRVDPGRADPRPREARRR